MVGVLHASLCCLCYLLSYCTVLCSIVVDDLCLVSGAMRWPAGVGGGRGGLGLAGWGRAGRRGTEDEKTYYSKKLHRTLV